MSIEILKNIKFIFPALSLIIFVLFNSARNTEARPTDVSQLHAPKENDTVEWLREVENPRSVGKQKSRIQAEEPTVIQPYPSGDKGTIEWLADLEQVENLQPNKQQGEIQEASGVEEADIKETETSQELSNVRKARDTSNACIAKNDYYIIYGYFFVIPTCKKGCKTKYKTVTFSNGKTLVIAYDCYV